MAPCSDRAYRWHSVNPLNLAMEFTRVIPASGNLTVRDQLAPGGRQHPGGHRHLPIYGKIGAVRDM